MRLARSFLSAALISAVAYGAVPVSQASTQRVTATAQGCTPGTVVGGPNLIVNGDFSQDATGFTSQLPNRGNDVYPDDAGGGGFSIQSGPNTYFGGTIVGRTFPGDDARDVGAASKYFYSNPIPIQGQSSIVLWQQTVNGLAPSTTYSFFAYFDNLLLPDASGVDPVIALQVNSTQIGSDITVAKSPDAWVPVEFSFTTGANETSAVLQIVDKANNQVGDDFGMAQVSLKECATALGLAKIGSAATRNGNSYSLTYTLNLQSYGVDNLPLQNVQVTDNLQTALGSAASFKITGLRSDTFTVNPAYNGTSDTNLLAAGTTMQPRQSGKIYLSVLITVDPSATPSTFINTAIATAQAGPRLITVRDISTYGTNPDPSGTENPKITNTPTPSTVGRSIYLPIFQDHLGAQQPIRFGK